jgi:uncharacterized membrane protein
MPTSRLEAFSDGVFAIAFTLLVLDFHPPEDLTHVGHYLSSLWPSYIAYMISVLLIGLVWANHHSIFIHIKHTNRMLMFLNISLLAVVAFLPFPTQLLADAIHSAQGLSAATFFYGLIITIGGVAHNAIWFYAICHPRLLKKSASPALIAGVRKWLFFGPVSYAVCTLISLVLPWVAIVGYAALIIFYWLPPRSEASIDI